MRRAFASTARELVERDDWAALILSDISTYTFDGFLGSNPRVVNVGIMEQTMVGVAAGFAMEGFHPIAHTIAPFLVERGLEQLKLDFGYQGLGGTFVSVGASYDYASEGATHHAPGDAETVAAIPGAQVLTPGHADEVARLMRLTHANDAVTYIRTSEATNAKAFDVTPGSIEVVRRDPSASATVLAVGPMLDRALAAAEGLDVDVLYTASVEPLEGAALRSLVGDPARIVTVEPFYEGTMARPIVAAFAGRPFALHPIGVPRRFLSGYGTRASFDEELGLEERSIRTRLQEAIAET